MGNERRAHSLISSLLLYIFYRCLRSAYQQHPAVPTNVRRERLSYARLMLSVDTADTAMAAFLLTVLNNYKSTNQF